MSVRQSTSSPRIWAFAHQKGGVAKTTSALGVAGALTEMGHRVLAVDLDPQASLTLALGHRPAEVNPSLAQVLNEQVPWHAALLKTEVENLDLLPATGRLSQVGSQWLAAGVYDGLRRVLAGIRGYDILILDAPPSLGIFTVNALVAAHLALIPTQAEYFSVYALRHMLRLVQWAREAYNPGLKYRIFITMFQKRNRAHALVRARLEATFGLGLCQTIIGVDTKVREAAIAGLPIQYFAARSRAAEQYRALTQEVLAYDQQTPTQVLFPQQEAAGRATAGAE